MSDRILSTDEGYSISYGGSRLADVVIDGVVVECVQVRDYDFAFGTFDSPVPTDDEVRQAVRESLNPDDMANYRKQAAIWRIARDV